MLTENIARLLQHINYIHIYINKALHIFIYESIIYYTFVIV